LEFTKEQVEEFDKKVTEIAKNANLNPVPVIHDFYLAFE
jgi:hypothetical protein